MQVEAGMCRKSKDGQNTAKTDAKGDTDRKTPKKTMRNGPPSRFLDSAGRPLRDFLLKTPQIPTKTEISNSISGEESAKTRVSAHASQEIDTPRAAADARAANNNNNNNNNKQPQQPQQPQRQPQQPPQQRQRKRQRQRQRQRQQQQQEQEQDNNLRPLEKPNRHAVSGAEFASSSLGAVQGPSE